MVDVEWDVTGRPLFDRMMVNSVGEKTRLPDDFAERYLLFTKLLIDSGSSSFMVSEMGESDSDGYVHDFETVLEFLQAASAKDRRPGSILHLESNNGQSVSLTGEYE